MINVRINPKARISLCPCLNSPPAIIDDPIDGLRTEFKGVILEVENGAGMHRITYICSDCIERIDIAQKQLREHID